VPALLGGAGVLAPLVLGALGADYLDGRNLLPVFAPLILVIAAGFCVRRAGRGGLAAAAALCLCALVFTIEIDRLPRLQREDLRNAAEQIGAPRPGVAVVTIRYATSQPLIYYLGAEVIKRGPLPPLREIDLVGSKIAADRNARRLLPRQFHRIGSEPVSYNFTLTRFRAPSPQRVGLTRLQNGLLVGGGPNASVLSWPSAVAGETGSQP
jgi:hypothetical protein